MNWLYTTSTYKFEDSFTRIPTLEVLRQAVAQYRKNPNATEYSCREQSIAILKQFQVDAQCGQYSDVPIETIHIINRVVPYLKPLPAPKANQDHPGITAIRLRLKAQQA